MTELENLESEVAELRRKYLIKKAENDKLESEIERINERNSLIFNEIDKGLKAIELIESMASFERGAIKDRIEGVVSSALSMIYGGEHRIEIDYSLKRNRTCVDISYLKSTDSGDVKRGMGGFGGGVADTMSLPLKLLILLSSNVSDRVLVADEPGKHIDVNRIERFGEFLHELSEKLGIQLIVCTHHEALKDYADNVYAVEITKDTNISSVERVKSSRVVPKQGSSCIRRVTMHNFESHKDTTVSFEPGFNAIVGESDCGKSAIIRALAAVCYNRFDNDSIRLGCGSCWIEVETDRGTVKLRKGDANAYEAYDRRDGQTYSFKCVAKTVPEIVQDITGIRPLVIGDIVDYPNMMFQMDGHYMLSEVNGEDCNSNMVARIMDGVIGLGGVEELVNEISTDVNRNKRQTTSNLNTIVDLRASLNNAEDLAELGRKCDDAEEAVKSAKSAASMAGEALELDQLSEENASRISSVDVVSPEAVEAASSALLEASSILPSMSSADGMLSELDTIDRRIGSLKSVCPTDSEEADASATLLFLKELVDARGRCAGIVSAAEEADAKLGMCRSSLSICDKMLANAEKRIDEYRRVNKICPLCGKPF